MSKKLLIDTIHDAGQITNPVLREIFSTEKALHEKQGDGRNEEFEHHGNGHHGNSQHGNGHHGNGHHGNSHISPCNRFKTIKIG